MSKVKYNLISQHKLFIINIKYNLFISKYLFIKKISYNIIIFIFKNIYSNKLKHYYTRCKKKNRK